MSVSTRRHTTTNTRTPQACFVLPVSAVDPTGPARAAMLLDPLL